MTEATLVILVIAAGGFSYRLSVGPTLADRVIALNGLLLVGMGALATGAADTGNGAFLPALVAAALVGPIGTGMIARFIEGRAEGRAAERQARHPRDRAKGRSR
ncbi:MAG: monovalent cation/H+ antiporter complex subunit F [Acidimicrobiales bacterium]